MKFHCMAFASLAILAISMSAQAAPAQVLRHGTLGQPGTAPSDILIENGKIRAIGRPLPALTGVKAFEASGKSVTAGLVAFSNDIHPTTNISDQDDPASVLVPRARRWGITHIVSVPTGCTLVFCGSARIVRTTQGFDTVVSDAAGVWLRLEENGRPTHPDLWNKISTTFSDARAYLDSRGAVYRSGQQTSKADQELLGPVLRGEIPLLVLAEHADVMTRFARFAEAQKIRIILIDGGGAWKIAPLLKALHVPVAIVPPSAGLSAEQKKNVVHMVKEGVSLILATPLNLTGNGLSPMALAADAKSAGVPADAIVKALSGTPADAFRLPGGGRIMPGADADIVVWSMPLGTAAAVPVRVFVDGDDVTSDGSAK